MDVISFLPHFKAVGLVALCLRTGRTLWFGRPALFFWWHREGNHGTGRYEAWTVAESRTRGSDKRRTRGTLRRGMAPHGVLRPGEHRQLLRRHADRLVADFPRQQSLTVFPPAGGSALHPAARPHWALVGLRAGRRQRSFSGGDPAGALAAVVRIELRGFRRCEMRLGSGRDSHSDQISPRRDHAS